VIHRQVLGVMIDAYLRTRKITIDDFSADYLMIKA
jgi:hypothetical protein